MEILHTRAQIFEHFLKEDASFFVMFRGGGGFGATFRGVLQLFYVLKISNITPNVDLF